MKKHVGIITSDFILYNKIRLLLRDSALVTLIAQGDATDGYDLIIADTRSGVSAPESAVTIGEGGTLPYSFRHEELLPLINGSEKKADVLTLSASTQSAYLFGEAIKLTDVEYKLLDVILSADGYVSKDAILRTVWGNGYDEGVVNVYIYYLRRKLEKDGRRVIISSRNEGYKIDEKYRRKG